MKDGTHGVDRIRSPYGSCDIGLGPGYLGEMAGEEAVHYHPLPEGRLQTHLGIEGVCDMPFRCCRYHACRPFLCTTILRLAG